MEIAGVASLAAEEHQHARVSLAKAQVSTPKGMRNVNVDGLLRVTRAVVGDMHASAVFFRQSDRHGARCCAAGDEAIVSWLSRLA